MKRRGYSIVEFSAVIFIIVLIGTITIPRLTAARQSQEAVGFRLGLVNLALSAREHALEQKQTVSLTFNEQGGLSWAPVEDELDSDGSTLSTDEAERRQAQRTVDLPAGVQFTVYRRFGEDIDQSSWRCDFYPDGTSDRATLEFEQDGRAFFYLVEPDRGSPVLNEGRIDDQPLERWDAGEIELRG